MPDELVFWMGNFEAKFPTDRHYAQNHMWAKQVNGVWRFGFARYAERLLQDVGGGVPAELINNEFDYIIISPGIDINKCTLSKYLKKNSKKVIKVKDHLYFQFVSTWIRITHYKLPMLTKHKSTLPNKSQRNLNTYPLAALPSELKHNTYPLM